MRFKEAHQRVCRDADDRVDDHGQQNDIGLQEFARIHGEETDPLRGGERLGDDQREPRVSECITYAP